MKLQLHLFFALGVILFNCCQSYAQPNKQYYWKGGSGNFNDPTMWWVDSYNSGNTATQAPNSTNSVFFTATAFSTPNNIVTMVSNANCDSMIWDDAISIANAPTFVGASTLSLDLYGSFHLASNMTFSYNGSLRFRSPRNGVETIETRGKMLQVLIVEIDGGATTEFTLQSKLYLEDFNNVINNSGYSNGGVLRLSGGTLNTNSKAVSVDYFISDNNNASRGLIMTNTHFDVDGRGHCWKLDFDTTTANYTSFDALGMHLELSNYYQATINLGSGLSYDTITLQVSPSRPSSYNASYYYLDMTNSGDTEVNHFFLGARMYFLQEFNKWFTIHNFYLNDKRASFGWRGYHNINLRLEHVITPNNCSDLFLVEPITVTTRKMNIVKLTPGILNLNNLILKNVNCDISGGRSYVANNSIDAGRNSSDWVINAPVSRQLYFEDIIDNNWSTLGNWTEKIGASFVPAACLPTPIDDVFFSNDSYTAHTTISLDNAKCRDITFFTPIPANSSMDLVNDWYIFGSFIGTNNVTLSGSQIEFFGENDTIQTNGAYMNTSLQMSIDSDYSIVGNYNGGLGKSIRGATPSSILRMGSDTLTLGSFLPATIYFDSTQVYLHKGGAWAIYDYGGVKNYSGNATFNFMSNTTELRIVRLPNVIFHGNLRACILNTEIQGDLTLLGDGYFGRSGTSRAQLNVTGSLPLYNGNVNLTAGKRYTFSSVNTSFVNIAGDLNATGNCAELINIETDGGDTGITPFDITGATNIDFAYIKGINNINAVAINATNSIDGGGNTNINFTTNTGTTFYWRANTNDPTDFVGNWNDPSHWTTNPTNLVGDDACIPSLIDSVIFDSQSFSVTSNGCTVDNAAFCRTLLFRADARLIANNKSTEIFIDESFILANNMVNFHYRGIIKMIGSGTINTNNTILSVNRLELDNPVGVFNIQNDLFIDNSWAGSNSFSRQSGVLALQAGTLNTNNYDLTIAAQFSSNTNQNRTLNLGTSTITILCDGVYSTSIHRQFGNTPWDIRTTTNMTLNASNSTILFKNNTHGLVYSKTYEMGQGFLYNNVRIEEQDEINTVSGNVSYNYLELFGTTNITGSNSFDSLRLEGGYYYYLTAGQTQTLNAPHGKLIVNGTPGNSIFLESSTSGAIAYLHKPYGYALCMDFIKVKDIEGTKETNITLVPTSPINFQTIHPFLEFQTGVNSDNINGSATGIWAFNLPPLVIPTFSHPDTVTLCLHTNDKYAPITMSGTAPYYIDYTWTNDIGGSGSHTLTINDDDNDPATPFTHSLAIPGNGGNTILSMDLQTSRCGELTPSTPVNLYVEAPAPNTLVNFQATANCEFNNAPYWYTLMDDVQGKPILAIRDSANASDVQPLGMTSAEVFFDPTVQTVNYMGVNYPYMQRHWDIVPTNNGPATVRLFFTQAELDALAAQTYWGNNAANPVIGTLNPATDVQILKYSSGTIGVGTPVVVPHTVRPMAGAITAPFSNITDVLAIEIDPASFSHIIVVPTQPVLLTLDLEQFDAKVVQEDKVQIDWAVASEADVDYYEIERSQDAVSTTLLQKVTARGLPNAAYTAIDTDPYRGLSYYRIKAVAYDGSLTYSDWKAVAIEGWDVVRVYPVPTKEVLNIELNSNLSDRVELAVYDALGVLVHQTTRTLDNVNRQQLQLQVNDLPAGVYYLQISNEQGYAQQRKFVVE